MPCCISRLASYCSQTCEQSPKESKVSLVVTYTFTRVTHGQVCQELITLSHSHPWQDLHQQVGNQMDDANNS